VSKTTVVPQREIIHQQKSSKILVPDEFIANVDGQTNKFLQQAVNKFFKGVPIISGAHLLDIYIYIYIYRKMIYIYMEMILFHYSVAVKCFNMGHIL
jgi:DNA helicase TIP49 (TBP-interacting protein)